ncbi:hypothetical protein EXIGLDRAFT_728182 [Exidia glandulosa HHB12029]|uniref:Uncharacterized protein n=1 Tax=Exidia glandulosa HHB12029 TaxID=1314781 RepID=A0A165D167_EXIGL|nr:hypothetical protein EXIGLDRAFT_728182 [Exidia glandulosa HHB12029]
MKLVSFRAQSGSPPWICSHAYSCIRGSCVCSHAYSCIRVAGGITECETGIASNCATVLLGATSGARSAQMLCAHLSAL